jgi:hypothetical protein
MDVSAAIYASEKIRNYELYEREKKENCPYL